MIIYGCMLLQPWMICLMQRRIQIGTSTWACRMHRLWINKFVANLIICSSKALLRLSHFRDRLAQPKSDPVFVHG